MPRTLATCSSRRPHAPRSLKAAALRLRSCISQTARKSAIRLSHSQGQSSPRSKVGQAKSSLVSRLTIRSSRARFAASALCCNCHIAAAAKLSGLTQALGGARQRSSQRGDRPPSVIATRRSHRPHTPCSLKAAALRLWVNSLVKSPLAHRTSSVQLAQVARQFGDCCGQPETARWSAA